MKNLIIFILLSSPILSFAQSNSLIYLNPDAKCTVQDIEEYGVKVNSVFGNIFTISTSPMSQISNCLDVVFIESNPSKFQSNKMDSVLKIINGFDTLKNPWERNLKATGKNVIVGIVDIGFQPNHRTFYDTINKKSRVSRIWKQSKKGSPPIGFNYGHEITDPLEILNYKDGSYNHGTHVAGIAAGNGLGSPQQKFAGIAPESEIVFVDIKYENDSIKPGALGDFLVANPTILDGYKYIFDYAKSVNKPAVINLSWGMHTGPHDGQSMFDLALKDLVGKGNILVGANGNDGAKDMHFSYNLNNDSVQTMIFESGRDKRKDEEIYVDIWGEASGHYTVKIEVIDTNGIYIEASKAYFSFATSTYYDTLKLSDTTITSKFIVQANYPSNKKDNVRLEVINNNPKRYLIRLKLFAIQCKVDAWNSGGINRWTSGLFLNSYKDIELSKDHHYGIKAGTNMENGGTSENVISVGALQNKVSQPSLDGKAHYSKNAIVDKIASFSSKGPTVDGRIKPDISAPGQRVTSALNFYGNPELKNIAYADTNGLDTTFWATFSGTSMASPVVTGVVALMLEVNPNLNQNDVLNILQTTARSNQFTGTLPNNTYGWGIINAKACISEAKRKLTIDQIIKSQSTYIYPNPSTNTFNIHSFKAIKSILVVNGQGQKIYEQVGINNHRFKFSLNDQKFSYYIIKIHYLDNSLDIKKLILIEE